MEQLEVTVVQTYQISSILLDWTNSTIEITLTDNTNKQLVCLYNGAVATSLMIGLNTANLSVKSLHKRIMERLLVDGKLPNGTLIGTP